MKKLLCILSALFILAGCKTESSGKTDDTEEETHDWIGFYCNADTLNLRGDFYSEEYNIRVIAGGGELSIQNVGIGRNKLDIDYCSLSGFLCLGMNSNSNTGVFEFIVPFSESLDISANIDGELKNYTNAIVSGDLIFYLIVTNKTLTIVSTITDIQDVEIEGNHYTSGWELDALDLPPNLVLQKQN